MLKTILTATVLSLTALSAQAVTVTYEWTATVDTIRQSASGLKIGDKITGRVSLDSEAPPSWGSYSTVYGSAAITEFWADGLGDLTGGSDSFVYAYNNRMITSCSRYGCRSTYYDGWVIRSNPGSDRTKFAQFSLTSDRYSLDAVTSDKLDGNFNFDGTVRRSFFLRLDGEDSDATVTSFSLVQDAGGISDVPLPAAGGALALALGLMAATRRRRA